MSEQAIKKAVAALQDRPVVVPQSRFADKDIATKLGARPGVALDVNTGIPWATRYKMENFPTADEQVQFLRKEFGENNVRTNSFGHPVVTITENGQQKDVLANPLGIDSTDLAAIAAEAPEVVGSIAAIALTRGATLKPGILRALGTLGLTALGSQAFGAAKDVFTRLVSGSDAQLSEIGRRRATLGAVDFFAGGAIGAGGFVAGRLVSPFSSVGRLQFNAQLAHEYFKDKYGVDLLQTAGEKTGSQLLIPAEAMASAKPGGRSAFARFRERQQDQIKGLIDVMTGTVPDAEAGGRRVMQAAAGEVAPLEFAAQRTAAAAADEAERAIKAQIGRKVDKTAVGTAIESRAKEQFAAFKATDNANYDALFSHPSAKAYVIDTKPLASSIKNVIDEMFPAVEKQVTKPIGVLDKSGQMLTTTVTEREFLEKQIKPGLQARLEELASTRGGKISLQSLKQIRTDIADAIAVGQAVPGVKEGTLKQAEKAVTQAIENGLKQIDNPELTQLWDTARKFHAANRPRFEKAGIAEIFRDPSQSSYLGPTQLVDRVTAGGASAQDTYRAYREFFGPNSTEMAGIQQAMRDHVLGLGNTATTINPEQVLTRLDAMPEAAFADAFGSSGVEVKKLANLLRIAKGQELPKDEFAEALTSGSLTADKVRDMISAQAKRDEAYRNKLVAQIGAGTAADKIQPTEVVEKFVFKAEPEHLGQLVDQLLKGGHDEALEDLKRLTFKRVLDDATVPLKNGEWTISPTKLEKIVADENTSKKLLYVLGSDAYRDLTELVTFMKPREIILESARSAGGISAGTQISQLVETGSFGAVSRAVKNFMLAMIYTNDKVRNIVTNGLLDRDGKALLVNGVIASEPFARALAGTFTEEAARSAAVELKNATDRLAAIDPAEMQPGLTSRAGAQNVPWDEFLREIRPAAPTP